MALGVLYWALIRKRTSWPIELYHVNSLSVLTLSVLSSKMRGHPGVLRNWNRGWKKPGQWRQVGPGAFWGLRYFGQDQNNYFRGKNLLPSNPAKITYSNSNHSVENVLKIAHLVIDQTWKTESAQLWTWHWHKVNISTTLTLHWHHSHYMHHCFYLYVLFNIW